MKRKGIILAGGSGTRLHPITLSSSKQLLAVYDKPMIYYPLSVLMLSNISEIAIITTSETSNQFISLLGNGSQWGMSFTFITQPFPGGLAQAYILAEKFLDGSPSAMVLGDNIFFGHGMSEIVMQANERSQSATIFAYQVVDTTSYGVVGFDEHGRVNSMMEKPEKPASNYAITGLYFLDNKASEYAKTIKPSKRGELEITSLLEIYMNEESLFVEKIGRGYAWLDTGTQDSLLDAANFVRTLQKRQGLLVGSPDEIAFNNRWITEGQLFALARLYDKNDYGASLRRLIRK
jgi:glucose-1-phosphate thymidylyltransferase